MGKHYTAHVDRFAADNLPPETLWPEFQFTLPELRYPARLNAAAELLDKAVAAGFGAKLAVVAADHRWTYDELRAESRRIARVLAEDLGLRPGNRVLLRGPNNAMMVATWFGVLLAGGVVVATMPLLRAGELKAVIDAAEISHALCDVRLLGELTTAQSQAPVLEHVLTFGAGGSLDAAMATKEPLYDPVATAADDVALLAFTSGTTGKPKGTVHFHRDILAMADTFARHVLCPEPDDIFTGSPPLAFTFGLGALLVFPLRFGCTTVLLEQPSPAAIQAALAFEGVTILFTAPTMYKLLTPIVAKESKHRLRQCVSAGEHLPKATWDGWSATTGISIIDGIGATEMTHIFISAGGDEIRPGATGKAIPGYEACVLDENFTPLPPGSVGKLAVRGPTGCRYLADERQKNYVVNGWNVTGDTYRMDEDGYFWFQARADDMIISAGYNIAGPEVEEVLLRHPAVVECAVVGAPDPARGQVVKAFVVPHADATPGPALVKELQEFVKTTIAPYKYPRVVEFISALPKTETGKVQRFKLRQQEEERARTLIKEF